MLLRTYTDSWSQHNKGVFSPVHHHCAFRLPCSLFSPFQEFMGKLQSSQASVVEQLVLGPGLLSCLREAMPLQRIKMSSVVPTVVDAAFLTAGSYSCVSKERLKVLTAEPLNQLPQQDTSLQPDDSFPAVEDFPHLQGVLSKLPALLARLTEWQEHGKAFTCTSPAPAGKWQPWRKGWATPLAGLRKDRCSRAEL